MFAIGRTRTLAWALGLTGALACGATAAVTIAVGLGSPELLLCATFAAFGLLGALVAARDPENIIGWLMCWASLLAILLFLPLDYGYAAQAVEHGTWSLGRIALWAAAWSWVPLVSLFLPAITVRFPDGRVPPRWRWVNWLALAGMATALGAALAPPSVLVHFLLLPQVALSRVTPLIVNPFGDSVPAALPALLIGGGLSATLLAYAASVVAAIDRYRHARGDERLQLKWFAYAGVLIAVASIYGAVTTAVGGAQPAIGEIGLHAAFFALPFAIAIGILRYRLYDIDLIINRTLVYGSLTAILAALYAAVVTLGNRLFISASGQKSDAAYFFVAFVVVVAAYPIKDWLQHQVDRRIAHRSPSAVLGEFSAEVEAVVSVLDVDDVACRLLDEAVTAFGARSAALYLDGNRDAPAYAQGRTDGAAALEVYLRYQESQLGRLVLGGRRGDLPYSRSDRDALQRSADLVGKALALAARHGTYGAPAGESVRPPAIKHSSRTRRAHQTPSDD